MIESPRKMGRIRNERMMETPDNLAQDFGQRGIVKNQFVRRTS